MPLFTSEQLAAAGREVVVKHENATPTGAFKVRGGLVYLDRLARERPEVPGVVSGTRGNYGHSLAYAGRVHGKRVVIVVPRLVAEPAGSLALAGLLNDSRTGRAAIIHSGGNCDVPMLQQVLAGETPAA